MKQVSRLLLLVLPAVFLVGCNYDAAEDGPGLFDSCGTLRQNDYVLTTMQEWYYWYDRMPSVKAGDFESPDALLQAVRYETLDSTFSYITTQEAEDAFFNNAAYIGFGFSTRIDNGAELYLREVFPGSPADLAGMARGDEILAIDGIDVATLIAAGTLQDAYGPREIGFSVDFTIRHPDNSEETVTAAKAEVDTPVTLNPSVFDVNGTPTGYVFFRSFNNAAYDALDAVFADFEAQGVQKLVLDLRYNGGGLISVAEYLGSLIRGAANSGEILSTMKFNDKKQANNVVLRFSDEANSLAITDIVIITTGGTASASELIINGLEPYTNVATVGATSFGKPVGQSGFRFCEKVLRPVTFEVVNANDVSGYFNGIVPTCGALDDLSQPLGDLGEASVAEAVNYLETGSCSATATKASNEIAQQKAMYPPEMLYRDGWDVVTGGVR
ncbi:MAG: S41 family peptidase [Gammaproteobacteria bacterium]|nr:S41 family peptidase [Gammaproteobacteria bacterium]